MARLLIIDDSQLARHTHSNIIRALGHETETAENGLEGLERVLSERFDAVLTDLMMPIMDGIGFLRAIKEKKIDLPTIIMSADIQESKRQECLDLGALAFLEKPATAQKMATILSQIFEK